jgi:alkylation response protein AidB-like acyl-CoA dehydrogenase
VDAEDPSAETFRAQVRSWLATRPWPAGLRDYGQTPTLDDVPAGREWQRVLAEAGYACLHWPVEHGGRGATMAEQAAFAEEAARAGVPRQFSLVGADLVGPVLLRFGTPEQRARYLPRIRTGEDLWCQLFSEPGAGSDLASLRTRAVSDGSDWLVTGQKVWTSGAEAAQHGLLIARTGQERHRGLSAFVVPMDVPGIEVRPLRQLDGESKFNEVFLDDVRLGAEHLVGAVGQGWEVATATLGRERLALGAGAVAMFQTLDEVLVAAGARGRLDPVLEDRAATVWTRIWLLRETWRRAVREGGDLGSAAYSVLKLMSSETTQALSDLTAEALGPDAALAPETEPLVHRMLVSRAQTILGGTSEIQRNILAERVLGLPRER